MFCVSCLASKMKTSFAVARTVSRTMSSKVDETGAKKAVEKKPNQQNRRASGRPSAPDADFLSKMNTMDASFNERLKKVFVTSQQSNPKMDLPENKPMPFDRSTTTLTSPHTQLVDQRTPNKLLVEEIRIILLNRKQDPQKWTAEYIACEYDMDLGDIEKLLANYTSLNTFMAKRPSEDNKDLRHQEKEIKIRHDTSIWDTEKIMVPEGQPKWMSKEKFERVWDIGDALKKKPKSGK